MVGKDGIEGVQDSSTLGDAQLASTHARLEEYIMGKKGGPRTEIGRLRSALNAVKHGLAGERLLLPGESIDRYAGTMDDVVSGLAPKSAAEAELAVLIADDLWKLERLRRLEHGLLLAHVREMVEDTPEWRESGTMSECLLELGKTLEVWERDGGPDGSASISEVVQAVFTASARIPDFPETLRADFQQALERCDEGSNGREDVIVARGQFGMVARRVMGYLLDSAQQMVAATDGLEAAAATIAILDRHELSTLSRYRRMLETGIQRKLDALKAMRDLRIQVGSDGQTQEYRVDVRLVR